MIPESGILLIDKPLEWTSFDVVNKTRHILKGLLGYKPKVGHAGTLDPLATGLLIVCYGKATKEINNFFDLNKEYTSRLFLGATTSSFDKEQPVDFEFETSHITEELIKNQIPSFTGNQMQVPPIHSAKWVNGKRAYEYARKGEKVEMEARATTIYELEFLSYQHPMLDLRIVCSKGFYVRSFARDFGLQLNSGAYIEQLRRTKIGPFSVDDAAKMENITEYIEKHD